MYDVMFSYTAVMTHVGLDIHKRNTNLNPQQSKDVLTHASID